MVRGGHSTHDKPAGYTSGVQQHNPSNTQYDPDVMPDLLSSAQISCPLLINCFALLLLQRNGESSREGGGGAVNHSLNGSS